MDRNIVPSISISGVLPLLPYTPSRRTERHLTSTVSNRLSLLKLPVSPQTACLSSNCLPLLKLSASPQTACLSSTCLSLLKPPASPQTACLSSNLMFSGLPFATRTNIRKPLYNYCLTAVAVFVPRTLCLRERSSTLCPPPPRMRTEYSAYA
jgi:hypothetical protein